MAIVRPSARALPGPAPDCDAPVTDTALPADCQNCFSPLAGAYCHQCGQAAHNPLSSFAHAVEDVFESFWHLDGRIFRTLRELWIPGRTARNYLDGQRVRYLPPLRLFVILSLFAFFIARLSVSADTQLVQFQDNDDPFIALVTPAEVVAQREELLADLSLDGDSPLPARAALQAARQNIIDTAEKRLAVLENRAPRDTKDVQLNLQLGQAADKWHPQDNPVAATWLPAWANKAINQRLERMNANLRNGKDRAQFLMDRFIAALPSALFVMMPLLALVLRLVYLKRPMGYLEHLVVALYSHAWLLTALLIGCGASVLAHASGMAVLISASSLLSSLLWLSVPVYLWQMQRRVYGGHWAANTLRFLLTGSIYGVFVLLATSYALLVGLTS